MDDRKLFTYRVILFSPMDFDAPNREREKKKLDVEKTKWIFRIHGCV